MRASGALLLACAALAAGCGDGPDPAAAVDESAGEWRTWILPSAAEIAVPAAPPALFAGDAERARGALERTAVEPWLEQAMTLVARRPKDPVTSSRNYALVAVAMYDAAVAAEGRRTADGGPATRAAITGAASRVIAYAFPEHPVAQLDADAEQVAGDLAAAGEATAGDAAAGLAVGRAVAERVIAWGRADGSDREFEGEPPRFRGAWRPPPGSAARPVAPLGGTWQTYVLKDGGEVRPPPPPAYGSAAFRGQVQRVLDVDRSLTAEQKRIARFWEGGEGTELPAGRWLEVTLEYLRGRPAMSDARTARVFALLAVAMHDAGVACWDAKYAYWVTRPENAIRDLGLDRDFEPYLDTPFFPAYVSGHASYSGAAEIVLGHLFPEDADLWRDRALEAAESRLFGGIHYPMDNEEGLRLGREVGRRVVAVAERDGAGR